MSGQEITPSIEPQKKQNLGGFIRETFKTVLLACILAFLFSTFAFRPFHIPSSSMEPALVKGDFVITSKYSLGYGKYAAPFVSLPIENGRVLERIPKRGDVIVFRIDGSPHHFIKRLVGLPGDSVQMRNGVLWINGVEQFMVPLSETTHIDQAGNPIKYQKYNEKFTEKLKPHTILDRQVGSEVDNTGTYLVPDGHYFFMGDNRDNSMDSRYPQSASGIGTVPASHLVGRAEFILLSLEEGFSIVKPWTWGKLRNNRFFISLR